MYFLNFSHQVVLGYFFIFKGRDELLHRICPSLLPLNHLLLKLRVFNSSEPGANGRRVVISGREA